MTLAPWERQQPYAFIQTDAGRASSKRSRQGDDCTVRALTIACNVPYDIAYDTLIKYGRKYGQGFHFPIGEHDTKSAPIPELGYRFDWEAFPARRGSPRMNLGLFGRCNPRGRFILRTAKHVQACIDGFVYDTALQYAERCVYGAWTVTRI